MMFCLLNSHFMVHETLSMEDNRAVLTATLNYIDKTARFD